MLLDSNAFLFWGLDLDIVTPAAASAIEDADELFISMASIWELEIKRGGGRLKVELDWPSFLADRLTLVPIDIEDAVAARSLPLHHRDPFDRMIIAQAKRRGLPVVTRDRSFEHYGVPVIWA
ncbi:MAG: PIN domain nuclease [Ancylobacter novellus]|uniref:PIN domain nuclease n=1 Tax=Ancylobacter novellus TaxID=921 RepID=A0A2W5M7U0_ANCNO|nr:MAG: PIN domain nuclease [Ancylobacter novellus]